MHLSRLSSWVPLFFVMIGFWLPAAGQDARVSSPFGKAHPLTPPPDRDSFTFAILGDRTGGPQSGLAVLEQAVVELNHLDPDLVMTVGDLINGYNSPEEWTVQMERYKAIMSELNMPWYPTAGNHDVYGPGGNRHDRTNEALYVKHFGPLYYSFDYKNAHFIVLFSDEHLSYSNPPVDQQMSEEQLAWLRADLASGGQKQVFVFLHHPRWNYEGDVWDPVHQVLAESGKVQIVFAGHWHRYRSDGERDGIRYYCLATTGAHKEPFDEAGYIHHYNLVKVREDGWSMAVVPVGAVLDPDFVTGEESDDVRSLRGGDYLSLTESFPAPLEKPVTAELSALVSNVTSKPLTFELSWTGLPDEGWQVTPETVELELAAGAAERVPFCLEGRPAAPGVPLFPVHLEARLVYPLKSGGGQPMRTVCALRYELPEMPPAFAEDGDVPAVNRVLVLDGVDDCVKVESTDALNPDGAFTLECWAKLDRPGERAALVAKTQGSSYGLWVADGERRGPGFFVYLEPSGYVSPFGDETDLALWAWAHYAGVFDGETVRVYVNGHCVAEEAGQGRIRGNSLPLVVGADVDGGGDAVFYAGGEVDEVRLSSGIRYAGSFTPKRRFQSDENTRLLLHFDRVFGDLTPDSSGRGHHARFVGGARLVDAERKGLQ